MHYESYMICTVSYSKYDFIALLKYGMESDSFKFGDEILMWKYFNVSLKKKKISKYFDLDY